jgi:hypothetical protein
MVGGERLVHRHEEVFSLQRILPIRAQSLYHEQLPRDLTLYVGNVQVGLVEAPDSGLTIHRHFPNLVECVRALRLPRSPITNYDPGHR